MVIVLQQEKHGHYHRANEIQDHLIFARHLPAHGHVSILPLPLPAIMPRADIMAVFKLLQPFDFVVHDIACFRERLRWRWQGWRACEPQSVLIVDR
jgi:hypothetical protein